MREPHLLRTLTFGATVALAGAAAAVALSDPSYTVQLDDELVRVVEHTLQPGQSEPLRHDECRIVYSVSNQSVTLTSAAGTPQDLTHKFRSAWWRPAEDAALTNRGLQPIKEVIVSFKQALPGVRGCAGSATPRADVAAGDLDAMRVAPQFYKVVFENPAIRVMEANVPAGIATPPHQLRCRVSYALTDQTVRIKHEDGRTEDVHRAVSQPWWSPAESLAIGNLGAKNAFSLVVELKHKGIGDASCPPVAK